jgi:hypothetical protein
MDEIFLHLKSVPRSLWLFPKGTVSPRKKSLSGKMVLDGWGLVL